MLGLGLALPGRSGVFNAYRAGGHFPLILIDNDRGLYGIGDGNGPPAPVPASDMFVSGTSGALTASANAQAPNVRSAAAIISPPDPVVNAYIWAVTDGTFQELWSGRAFTSGGIFGTVLTDGGAQQASVFTGAMTAGGQNRIGARIAVNDVTAALAGTASTPDTSATLPTIDEIDVGQDHTGGNTFTGTIHRIAFFGSEVTEDEMAGALANLM